MRRSHSGALAAPAAALVLLSGAAGTRRGDIDARADVKGRPRFVREAAVC